MEPLPLAPGTSPRPARSILLCAAVLLVATYALEARGTLRDLFIPKAVTAIDQTGPFVKGSDAMGYYAWLRSPLLDGDFQFENEFEGTFARVPGSEAALPVTITGHRPNPWPVGPAIVWAPAVCLVHTGLTVLGSASPWPADGYSAPYQLAVGLTTLSLCLISLFMAYQTARRFASPTASAAGAACAVLGTPIVCYGAVEVSLSHGPATAALAIFVYTWLKTFGSIRLHRWLAIGGLLGVAALMRWQLVTFALLPVAEATYLIATQPRRIRSVMLLVAAGLASVAAFIPQLIVKQIVYGHPLGGLHKTAQNWLDPSLGTVLVSTNNGLFYWTPLALVGFLGLIVIAVRTRRTNPAACMIAFAVVMQIYTVAALQGREAYLGWAFGFRHLTECCVLFAPGLALVLERKHAAFMAGILVGWNLILLGMYRHCIVGMQGGAPWEVLNWAARYAQLRPLEIVGITIASTWFTIVLVRAFGERAHFRVGATLARALSRLLPSLRSSSRGPA